MVRKSEPYWAVGEALSGYGITRRKLIARGAAASLPVILAACGGGGGSSTSSAGNTLRGGKPKKGGRLRTGHPGAGKDETLDPGIGPTAMDQARYHQLYNGLVRENPDGSGAQLTLAEALEPNKDGTVWNVKLRSGVEFHNGKSLTADDVIYSIRRPYDTKAGLSGSELAPFLDPKTGLKKINKHELQLHLKSPVGDLPNRLYGRDSLIYPDGFTDFKHPIGTGPFKFVSFTVGERSLFRRNDNYWDHSGGPYVDELEMISIADDGARVNALLGGQLDVAESFDYDQARAYANGKGQIKLLNSPSTATYPFVMRTDKDPFKSNLVREAFKLAVDRQKLVDIAFAGFGRVGNDMFGAGLAGYPTLPQRQYDPEKARALLKQAGHPDGVDMIIRWQAQNPGIKAATVYAEQAKAAGINLKIGKFPPGTNLNVAPTFPMFITNWSDTIMRVGVWMLSNSSYNEGWFDPHWDKLFHEAVRTVDDAKRKTTVEELNRIWYEQGPEMVWGYYNNVDGLSPRVRGAYTTPLGFGLSNYDLKSYWLD